MSNPWKCPKCGESYNTASWGPNGPKLGCTKCGEYWPDPAQERENSRGMRSANNIFGGVDFSHFPKVHNSEPVSGGDKYDRR